ncbi:restriction endonuclease subunit S [Vibrio cholerae]|nr:restriction endonuclease subunit S [Vibrio cholerae]EJK2383703.1 restriction endonuclease subunit S [Vibrio cholerae]GHW33482.1 restriction endonuclease subunit S [Vibrio cholerae]
MLEDSQIQLIDGDRGKNYPKQNDFQDTGYCLFLSAKNVTKTGFQFSEKIYISEERHSLLRAGILKRNDIVLTTRGTVGNVAFYDSSVSDEIVRINSGMLILRPDQSVWNPRFLYFLFTSKIIQEQITSLTSGSAVPQLPAKDLKKFSLPKVPMTVQNYIVKVIGDVSDKLDINNQTNQTLEQMAQAIFKSWFVDFDPVKAKMNGEQPEGMDAATASLFPEKLVESELGLTPEGWNLSEIGDEVTVVGGGTPSKKNDDFWVDGHIHWTSPKDLSGVQDKVLLDTASKLTEAGLKKVSSGLLPVDTVLLSSRAPVGYLALAKVPLAVNQGYIAMKCEKVLPPEFVLQWCVHRMDEIKQRASGSTFAEISKKNFKPISVVVPSEEVLIAYKKLVKPLYDAITSNVRQSEQLSTLRDTLLPKLLSGAVTISE